jgi:maleate isomerase
MCTRSTERLRPLDRVSVRFGRGAASQWLRWPRQAEEFALVGVVGGGITIGVLTPHAAAGPEVELPAMAAGRVTAVVARIRPDDAMVGAESTPPETASGLRALTQPVTVDRAAAGFRPESVDAVAYASTTTGYALGHRAERALVGRLRGLCGVPVVASASSAVDALRTCGARQVTLVHPPWFRDEIDQLGVRYFRDLGFGVTLTKATGLPGDPGMVRPRHVLDWVRSHLGDEADAVFIAGNGFRAAQAIEELEQQTGRLVLEANQVMLWSILAAIRTAAEVAGYGRLFRTVPAATG